MRTISVVQKMDACCNRQSVKIECRKSGQDHCKRVEWGYNPHSSVIRCLHSNTNIHKPVFKGKNVCATATDSVPNNPFITSVAQKTL